MMKLPFVTVYFSQYSLRSQHKQLQFMFLWVIVKSLVEVKLSFMDDGLGKIKIIQDHFNPSTSNSDLPQPPPLLQPKTDNSLR